MLLKLPFILIKSSASIFPRSHISLFILQFTDVQNAHCLRRENIHIIYMFVSRAFLVAGTEKLSCRRAFCKMQFVRAPDFFELQSLL